jgi:hypothetical protein
MPVGGLFYIIRTLMPYGRPATLTKPQYIDIVSYLLSVNGSPAGAKDLTLGFCGCMIVPFISTNTMNMPPFLFKCTSARPRIAASPRETLSPSRCTGIVLTFQCHNGSKYEWA